VERWAELSREDFVRGVSIDELVRPGRGRCCSSSCRREVKSSRASTEMPQVCDASPTALPIVRRRGAIGKKPKVRYRALVLVRPRGCGVATVAISRLAR
jgi:hypothetical protein